MGSGCRFTFQLTFWDAFKGFEGGGGGGGDEAGGKGGRTTARKAANLAKMLAHLLTEGWVGMNVLKAIDISPDGMSEVAIVFLTVLFGTIFDGSDDADAVGCLFKKIGGGGGNGGGGADGGLDDIDDVLAEKTDEREALKESVSVFLLHFMEGHPSNVKGSRFRKNYRAAVRACDTDGLDFMM